MDTLLWFIQVLASLAFAGAGAFKLFAPKEKILEAGQGWAADFPAGQVKLIGLAELLGAVGLVLPWAAGILPMLTPVAAVCLAVIMAGAAMTHLRRGESAAPPAPLAVMMIVVAVGRFGLLG